MLKRMVTMLLCIVMVLSVLPMQAFAADGTEDNALLGQFAEKMEDVAPAENAENSMDAAFSQTEDLGIQAAEPVETEIEDTSLLEDNITEAAATITSDVFTGYVSNGEFILTRVDYLAQGVVKIPSKIEGYSVTRIDDSAFSGCSDITEIVIPNSVKTVGNYAFDYCTGLKTITIPGSITRTSYCMLRGCYVLNSVVFEEGVEILAGGMFEGCTDLNTVTIPKSLKEVEESVFEDCECLSDVYYAGTKEAWSKVSYYGIGNKPFLNAKWHYLGSQLKEGYYTYDVNDGKATIIDVDPEISGDVKIPATLGGYPVVAIGDGAFCKNPAPSITSVSFPDSLKTIGDEAFFCCDKLAKIDLNKVVTIGDNAFTCARITSLTIPETVTTLGDDAFSVCTKLVELKLPAKVTCGRGVFEECAKLTAVEIPAGWTEIPESMFAGCGLISVTLPENIVSIGYRAFAGCKDMKKIKLSKKLESIGSDAFEGNPAWLIYYPGTKADRDKIEFYGWSDELLNRQWVYGENAAEILEEPKFAYAPTGEIATVRIKASGEGLKYQWYTMDYSVEEFVPIPGATKNSYSRVMEDFALCLYCIVGDKYGNEIKSEYTYMCVGNPVKITVQPENVTVASGKVATVSVKATGDDLQYQWYYSHKDTDGFVKINGATTDTYSVTMTAENSGMQVYCEVRDRYFNIEKTNTVTLSVRAEQIKLSKPTGVSAKAHATLGQPAISWKEVKDAESYDIYRSTKSSSGFKRIGNKEGNYFVDDSAVPGKKYYYYIKAVNGDVVSSASATVSTTCKCAAPVISVAVSESSGKAKISWEKVTGAAKYYIYRSTSKTKNFEKIGSTTKAYYTDSSAKVGTTYYYKVKAIVDNGNSEYSNRVSAKRLCAQASLKVKKDATSGKPSLSWSKVEGAKEYKIYRKDAFYDDAKYTCIKTVSSKTTSYKDTKAKAGFVYEYKIKVVGSKSGTDSMMDSPMQMVCTCAKPSISSVSNDKTTGNPVVKWKAVDGALSYVIYRSTSSSKNFVPVGEAFDFEGCKFQDWSAKPGKKYYYKVAAIDGNATDSALSSAKSGYAKCAKPVVMIELYNKKPILTWEKVEGAERYEVYRATSKSGKYTKVKTTTSLTYKDTKASKGKTYYYKVVAVASTSSANSAYSSVVSIKSK